jgi:hypothetical protein
MEKDPLSICVERHFVLKATSARKGTREVYKGSNNVIISVLHAFSKILCIYGFIIPLICLRLQVTIYRVPYIKNITNLTIIPLIIPVDVRPSYINLNTAQN